MFRVFDVVGVRDLFYGSFGVGVIRESWRGLCIFVIVFRVF